MAKKQTRIGLIGSSGRLGSAIAHVVENELKDRARIIATFNRSNSVDLAKHAADVDVFVDVSLPAATETLIADLLKRGATAPYVIGCTGWSETQLKAVHNYAERTAVVLAPNFSPGVNLFLNLIEQAAPLMKKWGYDISVHETHHTRKVDAPSGTAKAIVDRLGTAKAQIHSTRAGNIVGTHEVRFVGAGDILSLSHEALDRSIFARGAVMAAEWASRQVSPGLYSMKEVIIGATGEF